MWMTNIKCIRVLGIPDIENLNQDNKNSSQLEWQIFAEVLPHKYHTKKYQLKFEYKLLDYSTAKFLDINSGSTQDNLMSMFAFGKYYIKHYHDTK